MNDVARVRVDLPAPATTVFDHMVDPGLLTKWWPDTAEVDARVDGTYHLHFAGPDFHLRGRFTAVGRPSHLAYTWQWDHDDTPERRVSITLQESHGQTAVRIEHEAGDPEEQAGYVEGWEFFLARLRDVLD